MTGINGLTRTAERISDDAFLSLLNMLMEADPWPFTAEREPIEELLDDEARARGYCDWIEAIHKFPPNGGHELPPTDTEKNAALSRSTRCPG